MDTLFSLKVFCQVVESGSFTKASDTLGISNAMASKHVTHLEKTVNARLLNRTSRSLSLTNEGEIYHHQCLQALGLLNHAEQQISSGTQIPQGELRISAPNWFATPIFARWLAEYQTMYPEVSVDVVLDNAMVDLAGDNFDVALRVKEVLASSLIARPLMTVPFWLVASPDYLSKQGVPESINALEQHAFVLPSYVDIGQFVFKRDEREKDQVLQLNTQSQSNNTVMLKEMTLAGIGIGYLPTWLVEEEVASGTLIRLFENDWVGAPTLHAIYLSRRHLSAKIRSFIDFMASKSQ